MIKKLLAYILPKTERERRRKRVARFMRDQARSSYTFFIFGKDED